MKLKLVTRLLVAALIAFQWQVAVWVTAEPEPVYAYDWTPADVTVTYHMSGAISPITDLTLTDLEFVSVKADYTLTAGYVMLRGSTVTFPTSPTEGELIYYGPDSSVNFTAPDLDLHECFVSAFVFATDNVTYLETYDTATIGGEGVEEIATGLETLATTGDTFAEIGSLAIQVVIVLVMLTFAIWAKDIIFYYVAGAVTCYISYTLVQDYPGLGLPALFLGGYQFVRALLLTFSDGGPSRGMSQFKGVYNTIKGWFQ